MSVPRKAHLTPDDKALRKAAIDDWCARNGVWAEPAIERHLTPDEVAEIAARQFGFWGMRRLKGKDQLAARARPR